MAERRRGAERAREAAERPGAAPWVPGGGSLDDLRRAAPGCRGGELWHHAAQLVVSRGAADARMMLVGEQSGEIDAVRLEVLVALGIADGDRRRSEYRDFVADLRTAADLLGG